MANSVDLVIGSEAIKQVDALITKLNLADAELIKISQSAVTASKGIASISNPSGLDKSVSANAALNAELERQNKIITKLHDDIAKKAEQSRLAEIRLQQQREKAFDSFDRNAKKEADLIAKNSNAYNKTQSQITNLTKAYNDLSVRKERYNNLNANEEMRLNTLSRVNEKYNGILKATDATIGKNQRNVGNYASGYNALGNSINQLTREAPAFANSVNTGFMAISNNIPALTDAIKGIRAQNELLKAEGKPTVSVFKQLAGAVFSWQTAISLGVTLLTLYGGKLFELVQVAIKGNGAFVSLKENQEALNAAVKEGNKDASKEISQLDILYRTATNVALSTEQRAKAVDKLQELYPSYFANIDDEVIKNGKAEQSYYALRDAVFASARAKAIQGELEKRAGERLDEELKIREQIAEAEKEINSLKKSGKDLVIEANSQDRTPRQLITNQELIQAQQRLLKVRTDALKKFQKDSLASDDILLRAQEEFQKKSAVLEADRIKVKSDTVRIKKEKVEKRPEIQQLESFLKEGKPLIVEIDEMMSRLSAERILASDEGRAEVDSMISKLNDLKTALMGGLPTAEGTILNPVTNEAIARVNELSDAIKSYLSSFSTDFIQSSGFTETFKILNNEIEGFGENWQVTSIAIAESLQEIGNFISNASNQRFEAEKNRLQEQYDFSLKMAGDNKAAKEKLADDLEKKQKEIAYREAKAKQKQALFNIAIDTAQAAVAVLPNFYLAGVIAAIGIAQAVAVSSQEIPRYFEGGTHGGGLMMINDAGGSNYVETVVTPDGKATQYSGRDVVMNAPAGTEIFTPDQWNDTLSDMLQGKGISMSSNVQNNSISKADMRDAMLDAIGQQPQYHSNFDANGAASYISKRGNITRMSINRSNGKGIKF